MRPPSLLFVCLGNICRSPLAEAAFREAAARAGLEAVADSAGTGDWHIGSPPDPRSQAVALAHGIDISGMRARQVRGADFHVLRSYPGARSAEFARPAGDRAERCQRGCRC
jgi:protein-tyrosine phosphatase